MANFGFLIPSGGGEDLPLKKEEVLIGRRDSCDIVLRFPNVSGQHCKLLLEQGYWIVEDLNSQNGTKVNGVRVTRKRLDPGMMLTVAKNEYQIQYDPVANGAVGPPPGDDDQVNFSLKASLMELAGLDRRKKKENKSD